MLASVRPLLPLAGVTRLADITGLDRIGLPVAVAVRPNGRTLSQAAGRGITLELALLSAAMESIELFHAEEATLASRLLPYVELARRCPVVPLEHLPLSKHSVFSPLTPERWTLGRNLLGEARSARLENSEIGGGDTVLGRERAGDRDGHGDTVPGGRCESPRRGDRWGAMLRPRLNDGTDITNGAERGASGGGFLDLAGAEAAGMVAVPLDTVLLPRRTERLQAGSLFSFQTTSNGLASGSAFVEALTVALLEVIERDAVACSRVAAERLGQPLPRVLLDSASRFPLAQEVLERVQSAGVHAIVYDCTVDTDIPVYRAVLHEAAERQVGLAEGWGADLDPELALVRALTEAAQARVVAIAGARDDRFGPAVARLRLTDSPSRIAALQAQPATVDLRRRETPANSTFEQDVVLLLDRLVCVGVTQVIAIDLTLPAFRDLLSVVRVVVPMLAGPGCDPSARAEAFAARKASSA